LRIWIFNKK